MPEFRVIVVRHQYGEIVVTARSKKDAGEKAQEQLDTGECSAEIMNEESEVIEVQRSCK